MVGTILSFGTEQLKRLFPFHILIDSELRIISLGSAIISYRPIPVTASFNELFSVSGSDLVSFERLKQAPGKQLDVCIRGNNMILTGHFETTDSGEELLFIGSPADKNGRDYDFARKDAVINNLHSASKETHPKDNLAHLLFLVKNLESGIVIESKDHKIVLANEKFCSFIRTRLTPDELEGINYKELTIHNKNIYKHPDKEIQRVEEILQAQVPVVDETIALSNGSYYKRDFTPIIIDGQYEGHIWQYMDVTEQVSAEKKLEEQKVFYENVLNNIPAEIATYNLNHEYLFINPTSIRDKELRKWMIGKRDEDLCIYRNKPMSIAEDRRAVFNKVLESKRLHTWEEKIILPDGSVEYYLRNMYPVLNDNNEVVQVIGFGLNITDRKKIEDQVKLNEKRYRDLFNYSQAYICTHDLHGRLLTVNPAICNLLGYKQEELTGMFLSDFLPKEDIKSFYTEYLEKVINNGTATGILKVVGKDNKHSFLLYKNFTVQEENSEPYIIGFSQDITDRITTENELLQTKQVSEDVHRAKETFLANMSHEIRTPMTGILGIANLLSKTGLDAQQRKFTKLISESANNLLTIVNDVLDIEKIAAGKLELESIPFRLEDKVFTTLQSFQFKAEDKNINLILNSSLAEDLVVIGDPYRLSQILNNLLSNALKFTTEGEISINLDYKKNESKKVTIEIQVQDTGIGIKAEKLSQIFNPFVQATIDTTRKYGGTGLGLTICKNLVEMQGGRITVNSKINEGTTFSFYIPYEKGDVSLIPEENKEELNFKDLESIRILVAEDVELNQFLVRHILEGWGCEVTIVANGKDAVDSVRKHHYDLILMDIQMPEMDGITATKLIRALNIPEKPVVDKSTITKKIRTINAKDKSSIPIIALTANALKGDGNKYLSIGMDGYITKPYTEEKLFTVINQIVKTNDKFRLKLTPSGGKGQYDIVVENKEEKLFDLSMINIIGKDDPAFVKKIISIFLDTMPTSLANLMKASDEKNYEQVAKVAHKMKSSIDSMGITPLKDIIRELETVTEGNERTEFLLETVKNTMNKVFTQMKPFV